MFNPLRPEQLIGLMGSQLRRAADMELPPSPVARAQLLSAFSVSRHLQGELRALSALASYSRVLSEELRSAIDAWEECLESQHDGIEPMRSAAAAVALGDVASVGIGLAEVLECLRGVGDRRAEKVRSVALGGVKRIVDIELAALTESTSSRTV